MSWIDAATQLSGGLLALFAFLEIMRYWHGKVLETRHTTKVDCQVLNFFDAQIEREMSKVHFQNQWNLSTWTGYRPFKVVRKEYENQNLDICSFYLQPTDGKSITPYRPGQHIVVSVQPNELDDPLIRCYSLSDSPNNNNYYRITVRKVPGEGSCSTALHETIRPGDTINIQAPNGGFFLDTESTQPIVMLAGGIGITPFLSMVEAVIDRGIQRDIWLFYGTRNKKDHVMYENLKAIETNHPYIKVRVCYSEPGPDDILEQDYHYGEMISIDLLQKLLPSKNYTFMICGPTPMQEALISGLLDWGIPQEHVRYEFFGEAPTSLQSNKKVKITFTQSDKEIEWNGGAILNLAEENDIETIKRGCGVGVCGNCKVKVKSGEFEYSKDPMYEYLEEGSCLPCIAITTEDLTLHA